MDLLLNEQRLYDAFYATFKEKTYESLKMTYKIPSEITKLMNHITMTMKKDIFINQQIAYFFC